MESPTTPACRGSRSSTTAPAVALSPRRLSWRWAVGCVLAVFYTSLLPFDFSLAAFHRTIADGLCSLHFRPTTPEDAAASLRVYLPFGLIVGFCAIRSRRGPWASVLWSVVIGTSLSLLVETLQTGLVSRVASCTDILLNGVGATIGGCLGVGLSGRIGAAMAQVRSELADRPFSTTASLLTLGLFVYNLAPFDFVMTTDALHASFGRAHLGIMDARVITVGAPPLAAIAYQLTGAGWFAALGYLLALAGRERGDPSAVSLGLALKDGLILVVLVEFMQLFTQTHTFDAAAVGIRSFGVLLGAWCAVFLIDSLSWSAWRRKPSLAIPTGIVASLAVFQVGLLFAPCVNPQGGSLSNEHPFSVQWLPFETLWRQPFHTVVTEVLATLLTFGTLALTIQILLQRYRTVRAGLWTFGAITLTATTCESVPLLITGTPMDVTTLLLAWLSVILVESAWNASPAEDQVPNADRGTRLHSQNP